METATATARFLLHLSPISLDFPSASAQRLFLSPSHFPHFVFSPSRSPEYGVSLLKFLIHPIPNWVPLPSSRASRRIAHQTSRSHPVKLDLVRALSPQNSICQYEWSGVERSGGWESHHEMEGRKARYFSPCPISQMPWWEEGAGMEGRPSFSPSDQMVESIVSRNIDFGNKWESDDVSFHWPSRREGF